MLERVELLTDVYAPDGRLLASKGAIGTIYSYHMSMVGVGFDENQEMFIERGYGGMLYHPIPRLDTETIGWVEFS